jgi:hypothetical protein
MVVEGMHKFFTKFLPKDRTYGLTIEIYLAICIDSVGYQETHSRLAIKAGTEVGNVQAEMNRQLNFEKEYRRNYRKRAHVKNRKVKFDDKLREKAEKLIKENRKELRYPLWIMGARMDRFSQIDLGGDGPSVAPTIRERLPDHPNISKPSY